MAGKGLGAGLGALFGDGLTESVGQSKTLPISRIEPKQDQPRTNFDDDSLAELAESIAEHGIIQPLTVRRLDSGYYQIIAGERRWRASRLAGLKEVPVRVIEADDRKAMELALVENLQREDLNPVEEARGYRRLMDEFGITQENAARTVGKSRPVIANALRRLALPESVLENLEKVVISTSHARLLLELDGDKLREKAAREIVEKSLTVRQTEALVKRLLRGEEKSPPKKIGGVDYIAEVEKKLTARLGRRVKITDGRRKGRFEIEYYGSDDFEELREALMGIKHRSGGKGN
ncbi:MAG: ParB/RepB/Spo0J family partition protein [Oscillospiraceae bacterium]|nr:ParB/RepB/Spo0J family partition protein [Oscillospiraceae bacterium]